MGDIVLEGNSDYTLDEVKSCINSIISKARHMNKNIGISYNVESSKDSLGVCFEVVFDIIGTKWEYVTAINYMAGKEDFISRELVRMYEWDYPPRYNYETRLIDGIPMWCLVEHPYGECYLDDNNHPQLWSERGSLKKEGKV